MKLQPLGIHGTYICTFNRYEDERGSFQEWFSKELVDEVSSGPFSIVQANASFSKRNVIRGVHYSLAKNGQSKFVTCFAGHVKDILIDLRLGSPTYLQIEYVDLTAIDGLTIHIPPGVGHGFQALQDDSLVVYLLTSKYEPSLEFAVNAFDPTLKLDWSNTEIGVLSSKDQSAPRLSDLGKSNLLPVFRFFE